MNNYRIIIRPTRQLDQLGAALRVVALSGYADLNNYYDNSQAQQLIRDALTEQGFIVNSVVTEDNGVFNRGINFFIEVSAYDNYTGEQVRVSAANVLANIQRYLITSGNYYLFSNLSVKLVNDYATTTTMKAVGGLLPNTTTKNTPTTTTKTNNSNQSVLDTIADTLNPTALFGTTGVTVGVVAAILVLVVVLKR